MRLSPWRVVEHIATSETGPHGGAPAWILKLSCGHRAVRSTGIAKTWRGGVKLFVHGARLAPKRVRCQICRDTELKEPT